MKHEWMGEYREFVESIILLINSASSEFVMPHYYGTDMKITAREVQLLEYVLEDRTYIMAELAESLGITRGAFSNTVSKLVDKGLICKEHREGNNKNYHLVVTDKGMQVYNDYSKFIYEHWFCKMFEMADQIPQEYISKLSDILRGMAVNINQFSDKPKESN